MKKLDDIENLAAKVEMAQKSYNYQKDLTDELDQLTGDFSEVDILKIVLWKLNRYVDVKHDLITAINELKKEYSTEQAKEVLGTLLACRGIDLPMASTILRFAVPDELQILDQRAYRILVGDTFKLPRLIEDKIRTYFDYIDKLKEKCLALNIPFRESDRILYELDKAVNGDEKLNGY